MSGATHRQGGGIPLRWSGRQASDFEDTITQIADGIFQVGLTLETAVDLPADALRFAVGHALHLLDNTINESRSAAFSLRYRDANSSAGTWNPHSVLPPGVRAGAGRPVLPELRATSRPHHSAHLRSPEPQGEACWH